MRWSIYCCVALFFFVGSVVHADETKADPPSYTKDVKPFLARYCVECHNGRTAKSGYNLDGFDALMKGSRKGLAVVAGEPDKSVIVRALGGKGKRMPPSKYKNQPKAEEIDMLKAWIAAGAKNDTTKSTNATPSVRVLAFNVLESFSLRRPDEAIESFHHD